MLPVSYRNNALSASASASASVALADNQPHLGLRGSARSAIRGIYLEGRRLELVCDESVNTYDILDDKAVLTHSVFIPPQASRIFVAPGNNDGRHLFSNYGVMYYDRADRCIREFKKISTLQSVEAGPDYVRAANFTHYFEILAGGTKKIRLPGQVAMAAIVAAGHLFYVEQWHGPNLVAYKLRDGKWHKIDEVEQPVEWHFPVTSVCVTTAQVLISVAKSLYVFDLNTGKFAKPIELAIEPGILSAKDNSGILACDGRKIMEINSGKFLHVHTEASDEITALHRNNQRTYIGTLKGGLWRLDQQGLTNLLPASAFVGPIEVGMRENAVAFSSLSHELEIQCFFGGGPSLLPAEKKPDQSGSIMQDVSSELSGSRLVIRRFGELKNIIDVKNTVLAVASCGNVFTVDREARLCVTDGADEPGYLGTFHHPVRALEACANDLGGFTLLAANSAPGHFTILELDEAMMPVCMKSVKADMVSLAAGNTYLKQKGRKITVIHDGKAKVMPGDFFPLQGAALINNLLFIVNGGEIEVRRCDRSEYSLVALISITLDHAYLTHFPGADLTFDKYQSGQMDRLVQAYRKNGSPVSDHELNLLLMTSQKQGFIFDGGISENQ